MYLISHRGNIENKIEELENSPSYIDNALELGYDVEMDLWKIGGELFLGHDEPIYKINLDWLIERKENLWVHCKNIESLIYLTTNKIDLNYFWHDQDFATLTSKKFIWAKENKKLIYNSIAMIPDFCEINYYNCIGVCSDQIKNFKNDYEKTRH